MGKHSPKYQRRRWWRRLAPKRLVRLYELISHRDRRAGLGRSRTEVDFALVRRKREERKLGWSKMAGAYRD